MFVNYYRLTNWDFHLQTRNLGYKTGLSFTNGESWVTNGILSLLFTDYFFNTSLNGWVIPLAPDVLIIWMSIKGVLFNGTQHFPHWCWLFALCYSSLNSITIFVMSSQIDTFFYLELINQRIIVSLIFLTVYFLVTLLFFYISYRIALRKINKLSTDI